MGQEIERKFLVKDDSYKLEAYAHSHIVQGYICSARGRTVRVRIRDNKGYLTIKGASNDSGTSQAFILTIKLIHFKDMLSTFHQIPDFINHPRLTQFHQLFGLLQTDLLLPLITTCTGVELNSEDELFKKPHFIEKEVTGDIRYYNSFLMKNPYTRW